MKLLVIANLMGNSSWKDTNNSKTLQVFSIINSVFVNELLVIANLLVYSSWKDTNNIKTL